MIEHIELSTADKVRVMKCAARKGYDPYNSHLAYAKQAARCLADKARRSKSEAYANYALSNSQFVS